jgi:multiple sugar transport system permease protein
MPRGHLRLWGGRTVLFGVIVTFTLFAAFPFYWMFLTTFKRNTDLYHGATDLSHIPLIFNETPTLEHLRLLFNETPFVTWLLNTFIVGVMVVTITLLATVPAGYSLARLMGKRGERLGIGIFLTYLVPPTLLFIPFARLIAILKLQDSLWSLVIIYPTFTIPFCTWLLMGFFKSIPKDIEEQAMIDGYSRVGAIIRAVLPLSIPGLLTVVIFAFTLVMQEFVYALTFITSVKKMTVSLGLPVALVRGDVYYWGSLMGAALISSIPVAVLYNLFLDRFIAGITGGAVKG